MVWLLAPILALTILILPLGSASATPISWTLENWVFDDGGTASGSFVFDADTNAYSNISITTTLGSTLGGASYGIPDLASPGNSTIAVWVTGPMADFTGTPLVAVQWLSALTNAGGTAYVNLSGSFYGEYACGDAGCTYAVGPYRQLTQGFVSTVPEPGTSALFGFGLLGLCFARRRRSTA